VKDLVDGLERGGEWVILTLGGLRFGDRDGGTMQVPLDAVVLITIQGQIK
jgi:hypothetical protein